jgi:ATP-dependent RNA helicase SUPV3L1/SUV3
MEDKEINGISTGLVFTMSEHLGVLSRDRVTKEVKSLDQESRAKFRKYGFRFGQYSIYHPLFLKPEPTRLRVILWSKFHQLENKMDPPLPGLVTIEVTEGVEDSYYELVGFKKLGSRAIRIDMLERLADLIRLQDTKKGFKATSEMLSITGLSFIQLKEILEKLGYKSEKSFDQVQKIADSEQIENLETNIKDEDLNKNEKNSKDDVDSKVITIDQIIFKFYFKKNKNKNFFQNSKNKKIRNDNPQKKQLNKINKLKNNNISKKIDPNSPFAALSSLIKKKG